jgi:formate C-acetyltransferase
MQPVIVRRAKALENVLNKMTINILEDELIVGNATSKIRGGPLLPEFQWKWYIDEMDSISQRDWDRFAPIYDEEKTLMKKFLPYWEGKSLYDKWQAMIPEKELGLHNKIDALAAYSGGNMHFCHTAPDYGMVITQGLNSIREKVEKKLEELNLSKIEDLNKYQFYRAVKITIDAMVGFANRYADLAGQMAEKEDNAQRKAELERIAETCASVPANPARTFYEALQSVWFTYTVCMIEGWGTGIAFGRSDQYLYPFYNKDIEEGIITRDEVRELISLLYIKMNGLTQVSDSKSAQWGGGFPSFPNVTLGGVTLEGKDAVNELSYLFLEAEEDVRLSAEELIIRVNKKTPDSFVIRACEVLRAVKGKHKFLSDETAIQLLLNDGKPMEYARDYIIGGCNSLTVGGRSHDIPGGKFNLSLMLELALNNGVSRITGEMMGPETGDPRKFHSYDEVWKAYKSQVEALLPVILLYKNADKQLYADFAPVPFLSSMFPSCLEKGRDLTDGGTAPYMSRAISLCTAPNVGDSLAAIKKVVFEDKKITMAELIDALDRNFECDDELLHALKGAPKFGNDDEYVDTIVNDVITHSSAVATRHKGIAGAHSTVDAQTGTANIPMGYMVGALPDGRKAGEPLSEGGISPHQGRNVNGPTSTMRSVAKLDHSKLTNGSVLNMRFNPDLLKDGPKMKKFVSLVRTFLEIGGYLVQFNIVGTDTLKAAQQYPDEYRDLLVRVSTWSAYFVELAPDVQDDIITRMEFQDV